ncbi:MAG: cupredoxin domain-containing protein [Candidatus Limnocylindrales bacterium]
MRPIRLALLAAVAVLAAACSSGGGTPAWSFDGSASPAASAAAAPVAPSAAPAAPSAVGAKTRIEVTLSDTMKIEPAGITVPAGVPVTFVVTNAGTILHEFTLGDEAEQMAHDKEMMEAGGMSMPKDEPMAIGVEPGKTKELTVTFDTPGATLAGCHVIGHYAAGMKAAITIE